jgi:pimeloyl-ACP methyl ester carboxylesterase
LIASTRKRRRLKAGGVSLTNRATHSAFAGDPPGEFVPLLNKMAADVRPETLSVQISLMAEADQRDVLSRVAVPTLLIWGELDSRSPLRIAHQFKDVIPGAELVVIPDCGHVSNLERPHEVNHVVRKFCRAHSGPHP